MLYLLALIAPPLAVLFVGKPVQALVNLVLCFFFVIPGMIHAVLVVADHKADKRAEKQAALIAKTK